MTVLQVADLRFGYAGDTLFENVTFSLALGERAALVAPNGAGKSTLLRIIAKEIEPSHCCLCAFHSKIKFVLQLPSQLMSLGAGDAGRACHTRLSVETDRPSRRVDVQTQEAFAR